MNAAEQLIEQGRVEGVRDAIRAALSARGIALSELGQTCLSANTDTATLMQWLAHAVTATTEADVFSRRAASPS